MNEEIRKKFLDPLLDLGVESSLASELSRLPEQQRGAIVLAVQQAVYFAGLFVLENAKEMLAEYPPPSSLSLLGVPLLQEYQDEWRKNRKLDHVGQAS